MDGYQPPLLSLQDMLNLSDNEDNDEDFLSSNPFNISNFFEPIVAQSEGSKPEDGNAADSGTWTASQVQPQSGSGHSYSSAFHSSFNVDPLGDFDFTETLSHGSEPSVLPLKTEISEPVAVDVKRELPGKVDFSSNLVDERDSVEDFPDLDVFDEEMVTSELRQAKESLICSSENALGFEEGIFADKGFGENTPETSPRKSNKSQEYQVNSTSSETFRIPGTHLSEGVKLPRKTPTLREVKVEEVTREESEERRKLDNEQNCRKQAIDQLNSLINILKHYRIQLEQFLKAEGDMIVEQYEAKNLLRGILPGINESANVQHPFFEAHSITKALTSHVKGRTILSTFPRQRPYLWRGSDLLLLQKTILESVLHQREFFLYCRYTDLLTLMGFDSEDLERLSRCLTKESELGTMKIILNEHNFFSKLKASHKQPIQTVIINKDEKGSGLPRVYVFPSPEKIVEDKWEALLKIRRTTVPSNIEDNDIDWLYVLKKLNDRNPKLDCVDEEICKLTYDHLLSYKYNGIPWHRNELQKLQEIRSTYPNISWERSAKLLGTNRSAFTCFVKYKTHCMFNRPPLNTDHIILIRDCLNQSVGNMSKVDYMLSRVLKVQYSWARPLRLLAIAQKTLCPRLRKGKFTVAEDALLLVVMEKYRDYLVENDMTLEPISYALPWRYTTTWKSRFRTIFTTFYSTMWTLDEDKRLWSLIDEYGPNYKIIQRCFPLKNRKQCRQRHVLLLKIFETTSLEDYHLIYKCRKQGIDLSKLNHVAEYLDLTIRSKVSGSCRYVREIDLEFLKLRRKPTEFNLESYIMTFPVSLMQAALDRLIACKAQIENKWMELSCMEMNSRRSTIADELIGFDRRNFDPKNPYSIASALHLRCATLVPDDMICDLTEFEEKIYAAHKYFSVRSAAKKNTVRRIPSLDQLLKLHSISRIIQQPVPKHRPGKPSVIVTIKSEILDELEKAKQEQDILRELEESKEGGRRKGCKRKRTRMKEDRKRAANLRWQNQRLSSCQNAESQNGSSFGRNENIPDNSYDDDVSVDNPFSEVYSPCTPSTPASVASSAADSDFVAGTGPTMRKAIYGIISDHTYFQAMDNSGDLSSLTLPQLFARMGGRRGKQTGSENVKK